MQYSQTLNLFDTQPAEVPVYVPEPTTWGEITAIEPMLLSIERHATALRRGRRRGENPWPEYETLKQFACRLVGWGARDARLRTCEAYDVALRAITKALGV